MIPYLTGHREDAPHDALYWRFWTQAAGQGRFLFDLTSSQHERQNLIEAHPDIAADLQRDLVKWADWLKEPGIPDGQLRAQERDWYAHYFDLGT